MFCQRSGDTDLRHLHLLVTYESYQMNVNGSRKRGQRDSDSNSVNLLSRMSYVKHVLQILQPQWKINQ